MRTLAYETTILPIGGRMAEPDERSQISEKSSAEAIFLEKRSFVYRSACLLLGSSDRAEDVCQEVFLRFQEAFRKFRGESSYSSFLYGITRNVCREQIRREIRERRFHHEYADHSPTTSAEKNLSEGYADSGVNENSLNLAISQISKKLREPLLLYYYQDMSYEKIGETLGIPEGTVKSRINKAREKLAAALGDRIYQRKGESLGGKI